MNYNEALEYIHGTKKFGSKLGLQNITELLRLLNNPEKGLKIIHIAGTNGKGSTSSFLSSILIKGNYKVGLFTSPYLEKFTERIRINFENIPDETLAEITQKVKEKVVEMTQNGFNHPTEFEIVTAIAFEYYKQSNVDYVILEVGLGGRYDSTNIIDNPLASVITPISMDHVNILGDTLSKIAWEKAGIIKDDSLVISQAQKQEAEEVIVSVSKEKNSELIFVPTENIIYKKGNDYGSSFNFTYKDNIFNDLEIQLVGKHQVYNASTALTTILTLRERGLVDLEDEDIRNGIKNAIWPGRLEVLSRKPTFLIDGAHNLDGIQSLKKSLLDLFDYERLILGMGILGDKDVDNMVAELAGLGDVVIITEPNIYRALKPNELADKVKLYNNNYIVEEDIKNAVDKSFEIANENDLIVFAGSLYLIGDVRKYVIEKYCSSIY